MSSMIYSKWVNPVHSYAHIAGERIPYTELSLTRTLDKEKEFNTHFHVLLLDAHVSVGEEPLLLEESDTGEPISLYNQAGTLLWQKPQRVLPPWIAIIRGDGQVEDLYVPTIVIANYSPNDDFEHIYVPTHLSLRVSVHLREWIKFQVEHQHKTQYTVYDIFCVRSGPDYATLLGDILPDGVILTDWLL